MELGSGRLAAHMEELRSGIEIEQRCTLCSMHVAINAREDTHHKNEENPTATTKDESCSFVREPSAAHCTGR